MQSTMTYSQSSGNSGKESSRWDTITTHRTPNCHHTHGLWVDFGAVALIRLRPVLCSSSRVVAVYSFTDLDAAQILRLGTITDF